jgi:hypothetical protein
MLTKRFEREVLKLKPEFRVHSGHFYMFPAGRVLAGLRGKATERNVRLEVCVPDV